LLGKGGGNQVITEKLSKEGIHTYTSAKRGRDTAVLSRKWEKKKPSFLLKGGKIFLGWGIGLAGFSLIIISVTRKKRGMRISGRYHEEHWSSAGQAL